MAQAEQIRRVLKRQPFRPFQIKMVDGTLYSVPHPDWLSVPPARRPREAVYYKMPEEGAGQVDDYEVHWLDLALISEVVETMVSTTESKAQGNGE
jgi:hypothetical protein